MPLDVGIENLKQIQQSLAKSRIASFDTLLKISSLFVVSVAFVTGSLDSDNYFGLTIFIVGCTYQIIRMIFYFFGVLKWNKKLQKIPQIENSNTLPLVSIIVPCFNEEKVIQQSVRSLLELEYSNYEILIVDDGSTDKTLDILKAMQLPLKIKIIAQENSGKALALNNGILKSQGEYILCVDADSVLHPKSLLAGIKHFLHDSTTDAVAGTVRASNKHQFITCYQDLEYCLGDLQKSCLSNFAKVNIIPGPVGLFKKSSVLASGGYELVNKTFAEDTELTLRLISQNGRVVFEPNMISYTEVPADWLSLLRQRYRWTRGIYQALRKNLKILISQKNYSFSAYLFLEKVWTPVMEFTILSYFVGHFVAFANIDLFFVYTSAVFFAEAVLVALSTHLARRNFLFNLNVLLLSRFSISIVISTWKYLALLEEWSEVNMTWDKLTRKGLSSLNTSPIQNAKSEIVC